MKKPKRSKLVQAQKVQGDVVPSDEMCSESDLRAHDGVKERLHRLEMGHGIQIRVAEREITMLIK